MSEPQHLCDGMAMLVAIVDDDGVDGEVDVFHREEKIGLAFEAASQYARSSSMPLTSPDDLPGVGRCGDEKTTPSA